MPPPDLDLLAANLRADAADTGQFVEGLAAKLEDVLPGRVKVQRTRRGMFGPKIVQRISVDLADGRLELLRGVHDAITTRRAQVSGGIVLRSEDLDADAWLSALGSVMAAEARRSEQTRQALERLLIS
jgi:hypothetical protein